MRSTPTRREFVRLRAEGQSFSAIARQLHVAKATCTKWAREMAAQIDEARREELESLFAEFGAAKAGRVRQIGTAIAKIDEALAAADFSTVRPDKLLELRLKHLEALKAEYVAPSPGLNADTMGEGDVLGGLVELLAKVQMGEGGHVADQARLLGLILKAVEAARLRGELKREMIITWGGDDADNGGSTAPEA